jgi:hypothetical protein
MKKRLESEYADFLRVDDEGTGLDELIDDANAAGRRVRFISRKGGPWESDVNLEEGKEGELAVLFEAAEEALLYVDNLCKRYYDEDGDCWASEAREIRKAAESAGRALAAFTETAVSAANDAEE